MKCQVHSCSKSVFAKGFCRSHYKCFNRIGKPVADRLTIHGSIEKKFAIRSQNRNENGCWIWSGSKDPDGYGNIRDGQKMKRAHRVSWELHNGPIPSGVHILHKCNNPSCVNPEHLKLGNHTENMQDRKANGRPWHSDNHKELMREKMKGRAITWGAKLSEALKKLTPEQCLDILSRTAKGEKAINLAAEFGVHRTTISKIKKNTY
jgi:hypothetical protein